MDHLVHRLLMFGHGGLDLLLCRLVRMLPLSLSHLCLGVHARIMISSLHQNRSSVEAIFYQGEYIRNSVCFAMETVCLRVNEPSIGVSQTKASRIYALPSQFQLFMGDLVHKIRLLVPVKGIPLAGSTQIHWHTIQELCIAENGPSQGFQRLDHEATVCICSGIV